MTDMSMFITRQRFNLHLMEVPLSSHSTTPTPTSWWGSSPTRPTRAAIEVIPVASWTTRRHSRDDPCEDVGEDAGVGVGVVECELYYTWMAEPYVLFRRRQFHGGISVVQPPSQCFWSKRRWRQLRCRFGHFRWSYGHVDHWPVDSTSSIWGFLLVFLGTIGDYRTNGTSIG